MTVNKHIPGERVSGREMVSPSFGSGLPLSINLKLTAAPCESTSTQWASPVCLDCPPNCLLVGSSQKKLMRTEGPTWKTTVEQLSTSNVLGAREGCWNPVAKVMFCGLVSGLYTQRDISDFPLQRLVLETMLKAQLRANRTPGQQTRGSNALRGRGGASSVEASLPKEHPHSCVREETSALRQKRRKDGAGNWNTRHHSPTQECFRQTPQVVKKQKRQRVGGSDPLTCWGSCEKLQGPQDATGVLMPNGLTSQNCVQVLERPASGRILPQRESGRDLKTKSEDQS